MQPVWLVETQHISLYKLKPKIVLLCFPCSWMTQNYLVLDFQDAPSESWITKCKPHLTENQNTWKEYTVEEDTWKGVENSENIKKLVEEFEKKYEEEMRRIKML